MIIIGAVLVSVLVGAGAYVVMTRPDNDMTKYQRKDVLSLNYLSSSISAVDDNKKRKTKLSLYLNLVVPNNADINALCRHSRAVSRVVKNSFVKNPIQLKTASGVNFSAVQPQLLKAVRKSLGSIYIVDLDIVLKNGTTQVAFPRYTAPTVGCPR